LEAPDALFVGMGRRGSPRIVPEGGFRQYLPNSMSFSFRMRPGPSITAATVDRVLEAIQRTGRRRTFDTLCSIHCATRNMDILDRSQIVAMQTPQGAFREILLTALESAGQQYTDDMEAIVALGHPIELVEGDPDAF